jgi:hypothetical protein
MRMLSGDRAFTVAVDGAGSLVAAGDLYLGPMKVAKLDPATGGAIWTHDVSSAGQNWSADVAFDASGDVVVAGKLDFDFVVVKLAGLDGAELWRKQIDAAVNPGVGDASALVVDGAGDVIAVGTLYSSTEPSAFAIAKFAGGTGAELWRTTYAGQGAAVTLDGDGDVIAAGSIDGSPDHFFVVKLANATGAEIWQHEITAGGGSAAAVGVDAAGDVFAAGALADPGTLADLEIAKLDGDTGAEIWRRQVDRSGKDDSARDLAIDAAGDVVVAGRFDGHLGFEDEEPTRFAVLKFAGDTGDELWRHEDQGRPDSIESFAWAVTVDAAGDVIAGGKLITTLRFFDSGAAFLVVKLEGATGDLLWRQQKRGDCRGYCSNNYGSDAAWDVALLPGGDVIAAGGIEVGVGFTYFSVVRLSGADGIVGPVRGRKYLLKDDATDPTARSIKFAANDQSFLVPAPGSAGDPTIAGGSFKIVNPSTLESATFVLPSGFWRATGRTYTYSDPDGVNGPCKKIQARGGSLKVTCLGHNGTIPFTLDEPTQGRVTASLQLGASPKQCATSAFPLEDAGTANPGPRGVYKDFNSEVNPIDCP